MTHLPTPADDEYHTAAAELRNRLVRASIPDGTTPDAQIIVYICPTEGCGNFIAMPEFRADRTNLNELQTKRGLTKQETTHTRIDCPDCRIRDGQAVERVPFLVTQMIELRKVIEWWRSFSE